MNYIFIGSVCFQLSCYDAKSQINIVLSYSRAYEVSMTGMITTAQSELIGIYLLSIQRALDRRIPIVIHGCVGMFCGPQFDGGGLDICSDLIEVPSNNSFLLPSTEEHTIGHVYWKIGLFEFGHSSNVKAWCLTIQNLPSNHRAAQVSSYSVAPMIAVKHKMWIGIQDITQTFPRGFVGIDVYDGKSWGFRRHERWELSILDRFLVAHDAKRGILEFRFCGLVKVMDVLCHTKGREGTLRFAAYLRSPGTEIKVVECKKNVTRLINSDCVSARDTDVQTTPRMSAFQPIDTETPIRYSLLPSKSVSSFPSLTMENDVALFGFIGQTEGANEPTFLLSVSDESSEWRNVGVITYTHRLYGIDAESVRMPMRIRIQSQDGERKMYTLRNKQRAVFLRRKSTRVSCWGGSVINASKNVVREADDEADEFEFCSVLCGDEVISCEICDRFRIRFRATTITFAFCVGFVHSQFDSLDFEDELGVRANKDISVGIKIEHNAIYLFDNEHDGTRLAFVSPELANAASRHRNLNLLHNTGQQWIVEFDFLAHSFCVYMLFEKKRWVLAVKVDMKWKEIMPAFSLRDHMDGIEIV